MNLLLRGSVAALLCAGLAFGEWSGISTVGEGHKIRVETAQKKYKGTFLGLTDTAVKLTSQDGEVSVSRSEVLRVYSQSQSHRVRNTISALRSALLSVSLFTARSAHFSVTKVQMTRRPC